MGLSIYLREAHTDEMMFVGNITHNLIAMAKVCELYKPLWKPEELNITYARELIPYLSDGLSELVSKPDEYKQFNSTNGWGTYQGLIRFATDVYISCLDNPNLVIYVES